MNFKKILIINPFGIGDVLFTTPVIASIKAAQPQTLIGYWCNERVADILDKDPDLYKIFPLNRGDLKKICSRSKLEGIKRFLGLISNIKKERFDVALDFSLDHRYGLIAKIAGIKKRLGFNYKKRGRFLTEKIDIDGYSNRHVAEYYLDLLQFLDISEKKRKLHLFVPAENKVKIRSIFEGLRVSDQDLLIGIAAGGGASWGKDASIKHWPAEKFAQLADTLISNFNAKIFLLGDQSELGIADNIKKKMQNPPIDLVGKTTPKDLVAIINALEILVTNDGGPLHIAVALGVKTVSFFGPTDPVVYGPYPSDNNLHIVLRRDLACSPCYRNFRLAECLNDRECLGTIEVNEAMTAVSGLLNMKRGNTK